ncbi:MAG: hypothetical protein KJ067_24835 [Vicinamibacteria bacterium]|jgi:hypothetical protein|nr:hypothetical protein [Vicinamibacteria bacterium]
MGALPKNSPTRAAEPARPAAPASTAATTLAWIRALASDWTERRESEELEGAREHRRR